MVPSSPTRRAGDARERVSVKLKWFNATKGFGFVAPLDGSPDAFLHVSVMQSAGYQTLGDGAEMVVDLEEGRRGWQVATILSVDSQGKAPAPSSGGHGYGHGGGEDGEWLECSIKFFSAEKGYGFLKPNEGTQGDVFLPGRLLKRLNIEAEQLEPGQIVRAKVSQGPKGPMASDIEVD
ncbi:MAG: cold-shock protein [Geminicoccaceae bacterium]